MPVGFQDPWVVGMRFMFERDPVNSVVQPLVDLGLIQSVTPAVTPEKIELKDPESGLSKLVDERTVKISESYDIQCSNMNQDNMALLYLANPPEGFTQTKVGVGVSAHYAHNESLVKLKDSGGSLVYNVEDVLAVFKTAAPSSAFQPSSGQVFFSGAKQIKINGDVTGTTGAGVKIVVCGNSVVGTTLAGVYTSTGTAHAGGVTTVTVSETVASDLSNVGADSLIVWGPGANLLVKNTDWSIYKADRGFIKIAGTEGGSSPLAAGGANVWPVFRTAALSGNRLVKPQSISSQIQGQGYLFFNRANFGQQTVREVRVSITPTGKNMPQGGYASLSLTVRAFSDSTKTPPAGRLLQFKGSVPAGA